MTFPSPWDSGEHLVTRFPGPVTVRYRSVVCRAANLGFTFIVWKCWELADPGLAEELGLARRVAETPRFLKRWSWSEERQAEVIRHVGPGFYSPRTALPYFTMGIDPA